MTNQSYMAYHGQTFFPDWDAHLRRAHQAGRPFRMIKYFHPEAYNQAQAVSPGIKFIYRNYADEDHQGAWIDQAGQGPAQADAAADAYILRFKDSVNQHMGTDNNGLKFVESLNEDWPTGDPAKLAKMIAFEFGFMRRLPVHCPGCLPVIFCAAIGNPDHPDAPTLLPMAAECARIGGAMGYHAYTSVYRGQDWIESEAHRYDLHMRWADSFDEYFVSQGVRVNWMLGEGGPIKSNPDGYGPVPRPGWKHPDTLNSSLPAFIDHIRRLDLVLNSSRAAQEGRLFGLALFTNPAGNWPTFEVPAADVADYVAAADLPVIAPPPPEEPMKELLHEIIVNGVDADTNLIEIEIITNGERQGLMGTTLPNAISGLVLSQYRQTEAPPVPNVYRPLGCDVSHWQGAINFNTMKAAGAHYVFIKATEGTTLTDSRLVTNFGGAGEAGLLRGLYHFYRFNRDAVEQADYFIAQTGGEFGELGPVVDVEDTNTRASRDALRAFLDRIESQTGQKCIIYTGSWYWTPRLHGTTWANQYRLWEAEYRQPGADDGPVIDSDWPTWAFWQYSNAGDGRHYGASSDAIDLNIYNGWLSELAAG